MGDRYVEMVSIHNSGWLMDYMEDEVQATDHFIWPAQIITDQMGSSTDLGLDIYRRDEFTPENSSLKKRPRVETYAGPGSKACREKIRRDKLNDKFLELCSVMEPGRPPKTDKVIILSEAARLLNQLRLEMQKLKKSNEELQDSIKTLKAEKMEMKEEKVRLKAEKERMEQAVKGMSMPPPLMSHPAFHPSAAAFATTGKTIPYHMNYPPPMAMWQWMPPAALDTSQDHVLRPPVA